MAVIRKIKETPVKQGMDEEIAYSLTTTPWGSSPSSVAVALYDSQNNDVSSTCLSGSASVDGDVITLPFVKLLAPGERYRVEVKFTSGGNVFEAWGEIWGER